jgi:hypothetical protein
VGDARIQLERGRLVPPAPVAPSEVEG